MGKKNRSHGFSNPCCYERLGEQFVLSTNLVDKRLCSYLVSTVLAASGIVTPTQQNYPEKLQMFKADQQSPKTKFQANICSAPFPKKEKMIVQCNAHKYQVQWDAMQQSGAIRKVGVFPQDQALSRWTKIKYTAMIWNTLLETGFHWNCSGLFCILGPSEHFWSSQF